MKLTMEKEQKQKTKKKKKTDEAYLKLMKAIR